MLSSVPLPGALSLRRLDLVGTSQTPHVHLAHRVAYLGLEGEASMRCLSLPDGLAELALTPRVVVSLEAGVLHAIEARPKASLLVIVEQTGQLEAGETICTFPTLMLADQQSYWRCGARSEEAVPEAEARRLALCHDLAWNGFLELCAVFERSRKEGEVALSRFYQLATRLVCPEVARLRSAWRASALREVAHASYALANLEHGRTEHLLSAHAVCQTLSAQPACQSPLQVNVSEPPPSSSVGHLHPGRGRNREVIKDDGPSNGATRLSSKRAHDERERRTDDHTTHAGDGRRAGARPGDLGTLAEHGTS